MGAGAGSACVTGSSRGAQRPLPGRRRGAQTRGAQPASWDLLSPPPSLGLLASRLRPTRRLRFFHLFAADPLGTSPSPRFLGREMSTRAGFPSDFTPGDTGAICLCQRPLRTGARGPRCASWLTSSRRERRHRPALKSGTPRPRNGSGTELRVCGARHNPSRPPRQSWRRPSLSVGHAEPQLQSPRPAERLRLHKPTRYVRHL